MVELAPAKKLVLDTDVIIDHLRGKAGSLLGRLQEESQLATTLVNAFELYYGAYKSERTASNLTSVKGFLSTIEVLDLDESSMERSGEVLATLEKKGQSIDPRDLFIGCLSATRGYAVLTKNRRHLERIPELAVFTPSELDTS